MKRLILISLLISSLTLSPMFSCAVQASPSTSIQQDQKKLKLLKEERETKQKELAAKQKELNQVKAEVNQLEAKIDLYDQQLAQLNQNLSHHEKLLQERQKKLNQRIVQIYQKGEMAYMVQLLKAKTFSQFLARLEGIRLIVKTDSLLIEEYKKTKQQIQKERAVMQTLKAKQQPLLEEAKQKLTKIQSKVAGISQEIDKIKEQEEVTKEAIAEKNRLVRQATIYTSSIGSGEFIKPAAGTITSGFGLRWGRMHEGIDIANKIGTPIYAADSGVVTLMKSDPGGYGYYIVISHGNGKSTLYAHMYRSTVLVSVGQRVKKGQKIAEIGNNGRSTGPHLHFEVHVNGTPVNPMQYL